MEDEDLIAVADEESERNLDEPPLSVARSPSASSMAAAITQSHLAQGLVHLKNQVADRSSEMRETLERFKGRVFHAVNTTQGTLLRYRIGLDGQITLEKRLKGIYVTAEKLNEAQKNLVEAEKAVPIKAQRRWRKAVTGDPDKRIRDHMKETPQVKLLDKLSFTLGVIVICFSEWLILRMPNLFPYFYLGMMCLLMTYRYIDYSAIKSELYMLDFCYFVNLSVILQVFLAPDDLTWFKANYVLCMGPICIAIIVWRNSLVFHSADKLTSFFLHAFPTMVCHVYRWKLVDHGMKFDDNYIGIKSHILIPFGIYVAWQIGYLLMTEVVLKSKLDADHEIVTSMRHLSRDAKNPATKLVKKLCKKYGLLKPDEDFDPETMLAKSIFVLSQFAYTIITILHPPLCFRSYYFSCYYLTAIFIGAVWNGASYYIEVFSKRYNLKFVEKEPAKERKISTTSSIITDYDYHEEEDGEFNDDFAEALEELDLNELLASQILDPNRDDETASTCSKDESNLTSREMSEEPSANKGNDQT